jgi:hypothetical protein
MANDRKTTRFEHIRNVHRCYESPPLRRSSNLPFEGTPLFLTSLVGLPTSPWHRPPTSFVHLVLTIQTRRRMFGQSTAFYAFSSPPRFSPTAQEGV